MTQPYIPNRFRYTIMKKSLTPGRGHEGNVLVLSEINSPGAVEQVVDQRGGIGDVNPALQVAVGVLHVEASGVAIEQVVDQRGGVGDINITIAVHIATQASVLRGEVAGVARAAVDAGIKTVRVAGIIGRSLAAPDLGAFPEHAIRIAVGSGRRAPATAGIDCGEFTATREHPPHVGHLGRVETAQVEARQ